MKIEFTKSGVMSALVICSAMALSACGGGGGDGSGTTCDSLASDGVSVTFTAGATCINCSVTNPDDGTDGNFGSFATMSEPVGSTGEVSLRATRTDGGMYAAGSKAGVVYGFDGTEQVAISLSITTYLKGVMQQQQTFETDQDSYSGNTGSFHGSVTSTLPFDAVEYSYSRTDNSLAGNARVFELCKN